MKMVLKMFPEEKALELESERFWAKLDLPNGKTGFLPTELAIDEDNKIFLICARPTEGSFLRLLPPKPLPEKTFVSLAFQDTHWFELWSAEIEKFLGLNEDGLDQYELSGLKQEMAKSERIKERFLVTVPLKLKVKHKVFYFGGCELSESGIGLWLPSAYKGRIKQNENYELIFEPNEVEPFGFTIKCVRPHLEDSFSKGFTAGFSFIDLKELPVLRIKQLLEARGKINGTSLMKSGHYLQGFWKGESFEV